MWVSAKMSNVGGAPDAAERGTVPRRRPVQLRSRKRLAAILDATAALVDEVGPEAVTTTMIASRARISVGSVYAYYPNRMAIFDAIVARSIDKLRVIVAEARARTIAAGGDFLAGSEAVIDTLADLYRTEPGFRTLWFSQYLSEEMLERMRTHDEQQARFALERLKATGERLVGSQPLVAMTLYVGMIDKGFELAFRLDPRGDPIVIAQLKLAVRSYLSPVLRRDPARQGSAR